MTPTYNTESDCEEEEWDVCECCNEEVSVTYGITCVGYSIAECDACSAMCCRKCLDKHSKRESPACPKCKDQEEPI